MTDLALPCLAYSHILIAEGRGS